MRLRSICFCRPSMTLNEVTGVSSVSLVLRQAPEAVAVKPLLKLRW